ncbi:two-component sensor histidine kinase [hydrothermal vent metagenome]|uniref:histidine kinase n=1 Tax=hydrothermal vent metagenome TaxID=652676 RepID=A0A1W1EBP8_9ZZZZ
MGNMKKRTIVASFVYMFMVAILLSFVYWFLKNEGFSEENYLTASFFVLLLAMGWGYVIASYLLSSKEEQDANLSHLSSEILHELNIPLATIKANVNLLEKRTEDEKVLKRLNRIDESSQRLERLYSELVYSIKKEIHSVEKETFNLKKLLIERVDFFQTLKRNIFVIDVEEVSLYADKIGFEKMIDNLLMNAMKYSDKNREIDISLKNNTLIIKDEGIGMSETELLKVYERYYQSDNKKDGEGIGLALVKNYCDSQNINIDIKSKKGMGTSIYLSLTKLCVTNC